jgi:prepilin-type N-terminal cleavage/methylation domain-containing protein
MENIKPRQFGFTLVELLITIAIVGILAAIVLVNLSGARSSGRDAKRVSDIREIMTALQLFYHDNSAYPLPDTASTTGPTPSDGNPQWNTYLITWPVAPTPADNPTGVTDCNSTGPGTGNNQYTYTQLNGGTEFNLTFCLGSKVGDYAAGVHTASSSGVQ